MENKFGSGVDEGFLYEIGQPVNSSPAVVKNRIIIGSEDGSVYAFGPPGT